MSVIDVIGLLLVGAVVGYLVGRSASAGEETQRELRWIHAHAIVVHLIALTEGLIRHNDELLSRTEIGSSQREGTRNDRGLLVSQKRSLLLMQNLLWGGELPTLKAEKKS